MSPHILNHQNCTEQGRGRSRPAGARGGGRGWHKASVSDCLPLAVPIGLSPLLILTLCGPKRVLVVPWGGGGGFGMALWCASGLQTGGANCPIVTHCPSLGPSPSISGGAQSASHRPCVRPLPPWPTFPFRLPFPSPPLLLPLGPPPSQGLGGGGGLAPQLMCRSTNTSAHAHTRHPLSRLGSQMCAHRRFGRPRRFRLVQLVQQCRRFWRFRWFPCFRRFWRFPCFRRFWRFGGFGGSGGLSDVRGFGGGCRLGPGSLMANGDSEPVASAVLEAGGTRACVSASLCWTSKCPRQRMSSGLRRPGRGRDEGTRARPPRLPPVRTAPAHGAAAAAPRAGRGGH